MPIINNERKETRIAVKLNHVDLHLRLIQYIEYYLEEKNDTYIKDIIYRSYPKRLKTKYEEYLHGLPKKTKIHFIGNSLKK